jgi:uncharacterized membrane protein YgcG
MTQDRAIGVEVAPGLAQRLPDESVGQIIFGQIAPRLNQNDADGAVTAGVDALLAKLGIPKPEPVASAPAATAPKAAETPAEKVTAAPVEKPKKAPAEPTETFRAPSTFLLVAFAALVLLSTVVIGAIGWPRSPKKRS